MGRFLREQPRLAGKNFKLAAEMADFEWAKVEAFDGLMKPPVTPDDLLGADPAKLRLALQPYVTVLELSYPLDDFSIAMKRRDILRSDASNAMEGEQKTKRVRRVKLPKPERVFVAVHRLDNSLYYKRLAPEAYRLLTALRDGATLAGACAEAIASAEDQDADWAGQVKTWFEHWTAMGWFCRRARG
jgi:hypothetical protein